MGTHETGLIGRIARYWARWRARSHKRQALREMLALNQSQLDDIGYSRAVLEQMLLEDTDEPLEAEARRRSRHALDHPAPELSWKAPTAWLIGGSASPKSAAACGGAC